MDWLKIISAVALGAMIIFLFPMARQMVKESPRGRMEDWMGFLIPALLVAGFVLFLMSTI